VIPLALVTVGGGILRHRQMATAGEARVQAHYLADYD
jgi:hypothetical protein